MTQTKWDTIVIFSNVVEISHTNFDALHFFLKTPPTDANQHVQFIGSSHPCELLQERWSDIAKFSIDGKQAGNKVEFNTVHNIAFTKRMPRIPEGITLFDSENHWKDIQNVREYLLGTDYVEVSAKNIIELATRLVDPQASFADAVWTIADWVNTHIIYDAQHHYSKYNGALKTLQLKRGICSDFIHLFLAMTRVINIPSRAIIGPYRPSDSNRWVIHSWAEIFTPNNEWVPIDVTSQPISTKLEDRYIRITAGYDCAQRFYAIYFSPPGELPIEARVKQALWINGDTVKIDTIPEHK